jgi:hypothetical protein
MKESKACQPALQAQMKSLLKHLGSKRILPVNKFFFFFSFFYEHLNIVFGWIESKISHSCEDYLLTFY